MKKNNYWFSIIEILVGIFIFTMGLLSVYLTIQSSVNLNDLSKNQIIASNLSREWIELVRNVRDSNFETLHKWNKINPDSPDNTSANEFFDLNADKYYMVDNDYISSTYPVRIREIPSFVEWESNISSWMDTYRMYKNAEWLYIHSDGSLASHEKTIFYRYVKISPLFLEDASWNLNQVDDTLKITSKVIWYHKWYHEFELNTVITNWKKI